MSDLFTIANDDAADGIERLVEKASIGELIDAAAQLRDAEHGDRISYSRKIFIPLTQLCRDVCHYCTFAKAPARLPAGLSNDRSSRKDRRGRCPTRMQRSAVYTRR